MQWETLKKVDPSKTRSLSDKKQYWLDFYEEKIYYLARHCWPLKEVIAPSGKKTWGEVFTGHSGMTLIEYKEYANKRNLKEQYPNA